MSAFTHSKTNRGQRREGRGAGRGELGMAGVLVSNMCLWCRSFLHSSALPESCVLEQGRAVATSRRRSFVEQPSTALLFIPP